MKKLIPLLATALLAGCARQPEPYGALPTPQQLEWHDMEYYMFCHFGPNTFTGLEWGLGTEDPNVFAPEALDCDQWVSTAKAAGMKAIIITAKHHDGFCLWPSKFSTHTVAQSAWRDGKGDVLRELSDACARGGIKFGVYISPWDRNHPDYGTPAYNKVFAGTLEEVHSQYGPIFEQWFDGANGGSGMEYEWPLFHETVWKYSPGIVIFSDVGPGCRWVGNEKGYAGETDWCTLDIEGFTPGAGAPPRDTLNAGNRHGSSWVPSECDVSIRSGWFACPDNASSTKSVDALMDIWFGSVGRGGNLLLNVPPDHTGRIAAADSLRLMEFRAAREEYFAERLAASDGHRLSLRIPKGKAAKCIVLKEDIRYGQRIAAFVVEAQQDGTWQQIAEGTTIGHKRILRFDSPVTASRIRVRVTSTFAEPLICGIEVY